MSSYYKKNGVQKSFRFFEDRNWEDTQEYLANEYFIFSINDNDLFNLGYVYWAHVSLWRSGSANKITENKYDIKSYTNLICEEFNNLNIVNNPPNFGYNTNLDVIVEFWDHPKFKIIKSDDTGIYCLDEYLNELYFDLIKCDIISKEDLVFENETESEGSYFSCNPGDPVFMSDISYEYLKNDFIKGINLLNNIYQKVKFPFQIEINKK
jgi:hypothetical protein